MSKKTRLLISVSLLTIALSILSEHAHGQSTQLLTSSIRSLNRPYNYPRQTPHSEMRKMIFEQNKHWLTGKVYDPTGVEIKPNTRWHAGHKPGHEFAPARQKAVKEGWPPERWRESQRNPRNYRPELPNTNMSRKYELKHPAKNVTTRTPVKVPPTTSRLLGRVVPSMGVGFVVYDTYNIEHRYRVGELDSDIRTGKHVTNASVLGGSAVVTGYALLAAPEPIVTTIAGSVIIVGGATAHFMLERTQSRRIAYRQRLFRQVGEKERNNGIFEELRGMVN